MSGVAQIEFRRYLAFANCLESLFIASARRQFNFRLRSHRTFDAQFAAGGLVAEVVNDEFKLVCFVQLKRRLLEIAVAELVEVRPDWPFLRPISPFLVAVRFSVPSNRHAAATKILVPVLAQPCVPSATFDLGSRRLLQQWEI